MPDAASAIIVESVSPVEVAGQLRLSITRLARILRQQDPGSLGPTLTSALASVHRSGPAHRAEGIMGITLGELAEREHVTPPTITRVVEKLEARGLVARGVDPQDRRVVRLQVTPAGEEHLEEARSRRTAWLASRLQELAAGDLVALAGAASVLDRLAAGAIPGEARP